MNSLLERQKILRRIRLWIGIMIVGLVVSGLTAIPLRREVESLIRLTGVENERHSDHNFVGDWTKWLIRVGDALRDVEERHPFLAYGTDWLAFGHLVIALAFIGAWRDPVRNLWLFNFGLIACLAVIPWALVFGAIRGIPFWWRLIDCSFGIAGAIPLWLGRSATVTLESELRSGSSDHETLW